ncbi:hypothetical protein DEGR_34060 (plasmid) [Deinococcus grandis]|nr:hypothetical protein DEGR_34060 [Deinococcus grandis]
MARVLAGACPQGTARTGWGDEFCLLLRGAPGQIPDLDAAFAALAGEGFGPAGASAGWASAPQDGQAPEVLWQLADERMYREKARRRPGR